MPSITATLPTGPEAAAAELHRLNVPAAVANWQLTKTVAELRETVAELREQTRVHDVLVDVVAAGRGEQGIAQALHELTGRAVAVEDRFGNLRAWAGPGQPRPYPKQDRVAHNELLREAARRGGSVPHQDRLIALVQPGSEVLGVLALVDPDGSATGLQVYALERAAAVLALELAHQRSLAEVELRLRRDVVADLISGTDADADESSAFARAAALGYDLHGAHRVVVVQRVDRPTDEALAGAVERAVAELRLGALVARRSGVVALIAHEQPNGRELYAAVRRRVNSSAVAVGVGGRCDAAGLPRSFDEALRALETRKISRQPVGATVFDELGIYRLLSAVGGNQEIADYVHEWLGALLDYDAGHSSDLVPTLSEYLECGGNYDATAHALVIHRSTLRYRLQRIREVSGLDLGEVESRLNLHLATRAWRVLQASCDDDAPR